MSQGLFSIVRLITPIYARALGKTLTYDYIKNMLVSGEIGGTWALRLIMMEMPAKKRNGEIEAELIEMLPECRKRLATSVKGVNEAAITREESRHELSGRLCSKPPHQEHREKAPSSNGINKSTTEEDSEHDRE